MTDTRSESLERGLEATEESVPAGARLDVSAARSSVAVLRSLRCSRRELIVAITAAVVSMIPIAWFARDFWFRFDDFPLVANRQIGSLDDWFRPHHDHWLTWTVLVVRGMRGLFGLQYWPGWFLPRLIGQAALSFLVWRTLVHRGADRIIAFGVYLAFLVLAVSYFEDALTIGNFVLFPVFIAVALVVSEVDHPRPRDLVLVGAGLVAAVMANGYGVAVLLALAVVTSFRRRLGRWLPAFVPPAVAVALWYAFYHSQLSHHDLSATVVRKAFEPSFVVVRTAFENTFGLPGAVAAGLVVVTGAVLVVWARSGVLDAFDVLIAVTLLFALGVLAWGRITHPGVADAAHYGFAVVLLLTLLVVPHLPSPSGPLARGAVIAVLAGIVVFNVVSLTGRLERRGEVDRSIRTDAQTTAALIAAGEAYSDFAHVGRGVQPRRIRLLVDDGWRPRRSSDPDVVRRVRKRMRFVVGGIAARNAAQARGHVAPTARDVDLSGCRRTLFPTTVRLRVTGPGAFRVDRKVSVAWIDRFGTVREELGPAQVGLARPIGPTTVTIDSVGPTTICELAPIPPS